MVDTTCFPGGLGGGVGGDVITSVGNFTHGRYYMFSAARHARTASVPVYLLRAAFLNCLFFLGLFCFPSALFCFLALLGNLFSAIRHRIFSAKG